MKPWKYRHLVTNFESNPYTILIKGDRKTAEKMARIGAVCHTDKTIKRMINHDKV